MGEPFVSVAAQFRLSVADDIRFTAVETRLVETREARALTLEVVARQLRAPQYGVTEIERGNTRRLDTPPLGRYIEAMELRSWFGR